MPRSGEWSLLLYMLKLHVTYAIGIILESVSDSILDLLFIGSINDVENTMAME